VNPGFGAQRFIPRAERKIAAVRALLDAAGNPAPIEVDGGIDLDTAPLVAAAGARILVAGNAIFGAADPVRAMQAIRAAAVAAVPAGAVR
jgi:ribulose-phosphate 3-epimerase